MKENKDFIVEEKPPFKTKYVADGSGLKPNTLVLNCEEIILAQKSIGFEIDIQDKLDYIDIVIINGIEFVKKTDKEEI